MAHHFVMYLGDNLLADGLRGSSFDLPREEPDALILLTPVGPRVLRGRRAGRGTGRAPGREAERPAFEPRPGRRLPLRPAIFDAARALEPSWRGELEITEAIQSLIEEGKR